MSENNNINIPHLSDLIKEISAIVIVDDARNVSDEEMAEIRKSVELEKSISEGEKIIDSFRGENYFLSNFFQCDFEYEGLTYHTAEAAFQAQKCSSVEETTDSQVADKSFPFSKSIDFFPSERPFKKSSTDSRFE